MSVHRLKRKPLLIGLNNPHSSEPRFALFPRPAHATGARILDMIQLVDPLFSESDSMHHFERMNVWPGRELPSGRGKTALLAREGARIFSKLSKDGEREVAIFGLAAWDAILDRSHPEPFAFEQIGAARFFFFPHPSRRNFQYRSTALRSACGAALLSLTGRSLEWNRSLASSQT